MPGKRKKLPAPVAISDSVDSVMDRIIPERGRLRKILALWREMLGEEVFINARPTSIRRNNLYVTISDPIWQSEMRYFTDGLLRRINSVLTKKEQIDQIRFRVGCLEGVSRETDILKTAQEKIGKVVDELPAHLREPVMKVSDPSLRSILARLAASLSEGDDVQKGKGRKK